MGSPYNQLQQLSLTYSGREIGIDKYKPYTFSNEKPEFELSYYGSLFQSLVERTYSYSSHVQSGGVDGGLKESYFLRTSRSGSQVAQPYDVGRLVVGITGQQSFYPVDRVNFITSNTGFVGNNLSDNFKYTTSLPSGKFNSTISETTARVSTYIKSGSFKRVDRDVAEISFSFFAGVYYSGEFTPPHVPVNNPFSGEDNASITFVMFTGSYQGA